MPFKGDSSSSSDSSSSASDSNCSRSPKSYSGSLSLAELFWVSLIGLGIDKLIASLLACFSALFCAIAPREGLGIDFKTSRFYSLLIRTKRGLNFDFAYLPPVLQIGLDRGCRSDCQILRLNHHQSRFVFRTILVLAIGLFVSPQFVRERFR